jgi:hypothetical protein
MFKDFSPEWEEQDELKPYTKLAKWYNIIMKSHESQKFIKQYDSQARELIHSRII